MSVQQITTPFFTAANIETEVQRVLREALEHVAAHGAQEVVDGPDPTNACIVSICGLPFGASTLEEAPLSAARLMIQEMTRGLDASDGCDDEFGCLAWDYAEALEALNTYICTCDMSDAYVCAVIEAAYHRITAPLLGSSGPTPAVN